MADSENVVPSNENDGTAADPGAPAPDELQDAPVREQAQSRKSNKGQMILTTEEIGDDLGIGGSKWWGGALAADECIYCAPYNHGRILKIDPKTDTTTLVGEFIRGNAYGGAAASMDGWFIYFVSRNAEIVLKYDVRAKEWTEIGEELDGIWSGAVVAADGCIYAAPLFGNQILKINPSNNDKIDLIETPLSQETAFGYESPVLSSDKKQIYFIPSKADRILRFHIETGESDLVGDGYDGEWKWAGGALGNDGCIYAMPSNFNKILKYDPKTNSTDLVGDDFGGGRSRWNGCFNGRDGCIYGIPHENEQILRFDPLTEKCSLVGKKYRGLNKWMESVMANNDSVYAIPHIYNRVLKISLRPASDLTASICGVNDTINTVDLLGFDLYAKILADQAKSLQAINEPLCVGLLAPWGSGKSFFWKRIRKELEGAKQKSQQGNAPIRPKEGKRGKSEEGLSLKEISTNSVYKIIWAISKISSLKCCHDSDCFRFAVLVLFSPLWLLLWFVLVLNGLKDKARGKVSKERSDEEKRALLSSVFLQRKQRMMSTKEVSLKEISTNSFYKIIWAIDKISSWKYLLHCCDIPCFRIVVLVLFIPLWFSSWLALVLYGLEAKARGQKVFREVSDEKERASVWKKFMGEDEDPEDKEMQSLVSVGRVKESGDIFVEFGAWTYRGTENLWASLMEEIWTEVEVQTDADDVRWHRAGCKRLEEEKGFVADPAKRAEDQHERAYEQMLATDRMRWRFQSWYSLYIGAIVSFFVLIAVNTAWAITSNKNYTTAVPTFHNSTTVPTMSPDEVGVSSLSWILGILIPFASGIISAFKASQAKAYAITGYESIQKQIGTRESKLSLNSFARKDFTERQGFMGEVKKEVAFLIDYLQCQNKRLVIFVDDLDRCNQDMTMEILWAVKLLLSEGPISCWLAIDSKIVVDYIESEFQADISGYQYLEKIINLPFSIPAMDEKSKEQFLEGVVDAPELNIDQVYSKLMSVQLIDIYVESDRRLEKLIEFAKERGDEPDIKHFSKQHPVELNEDNLKKDMKMSQCFFSALLNVARVNVVTAYENFYSLVKKEKWIKCTLVDSITPFYSSVGNEGFRIKRTLGDAITPLPLRSPKVDEEFQSLRDEKILEAELRGFLLKVKEKAESCQGDLDINLECTGWKFAKMANNVFEQMKYAVEDSDMKLSEGEEREKLFMMKFLQIKSSPSNRYTPSSNHESLTLGSSGLTTDSASAFSDTPAPVSPVSIQSQDTATTPTHAVYKNLSMIQDEERRLMRKYARFLSDVPRKIKRIVNVYAVTRNIAEESLVGLGRDQESLIYEKLFILAVLQETFPYRTSWLVFMAICAETGPDEFNCIDGQKEAIFHDLLVEVAGDEQKFGNVTLSVVYHQIVSKMLLCLPNSRNLIRADTDPDQFKPLLRGLKLSDLFRFNGGLQKYLFNLPRGMINDIKQCYNHCIPEIQKEKVSFKKLSSFQDTIG